VKNSNQLLIDLGGWEYTDSNETLLPGIWNEYTRGLPRKKHHTIIYEKAQVLQITGVLFETKRDFKKKNYEPSASRKGEIKFEVWTIVYESPPQALREKKTSETFQQLVGTGLTHLIISPRQSWCKCPKSLSFHHRSAGPKESN